MSSHDCMSMPDGCFGACSYVVCKPMTCDFLDLFGGMCVWKNVCDGYSVSTCCTTSFDNAALHTYQ